MRNGGWKSRLPYHDVWVRNREWGQRPALGSTNRLMKGLYSSLMPVNSWSHDGNPDIPQPGAIFNLEFSPDGSLLVAACEKKSFLMFDPLTRKMIISGANAHDDCVNCVRFLDSRIFATCSDDKTVALWDTRNLRNRLRTLQGHSNWVKNIEFSQKDGLLVTSGFDGAIYTWDINSYTECGFIYNRVFHTNGLMRTRLTPDGSKMIICTTGGYLIVIHDLDLNTLEQDLSGFKPNMYRLMQLSLTTIPVAANFTQLFSRRRKKNRVEFIADFPENDDAEVVSSLQVHPQGWCVLSRNISNHEKSEWTCIHDIQDDPVSDTEALELEDCSTDFEPSEAETNGNEPSQDGDRAVPSSVSALQALFQNVIDGSNVRDSSGRGRQAQTTEQESPRRNSEATVSSADVWEALIAIRFHRERERRNAANSQFDSSRMNIVRTFSGLQDLNVNSLLDNLMQRDTNNSETRSNNDSNSDDNENDNDNDDDSANNNPSERSNSSYIIFRYRYNQNSDNQEASTSSSTSNVSENADNGSSSRGSSEPVTRVRNSQIGNSNGHTVVILSSQPQAGNLSERLGSSFSSYKVPKNHKTHQNKPRLLHYIEECNVGKGFIKELCFSSDGRIVCSPFSYGVRLLSFNSDCAELSTCVPENPPVTLHELATNNPHTDIVVSTKFSPTSCLLVSGCLAGKIVYHQPGY